MGFLNDGSVDTIDTLLQTGQDSNGEKLKFKLNEKTGSYEAEGTDKKIYYIDPQFATAKVSVADVPQKKKETDFDKIAEKRAEADSKKKF